VKSAILQTLGALLEKTPAMLRPFLPQLQRTFCKALLESFSSVRENAARCLSFLIPLQPRLDPLLMELVQAYGSAEEKGIKEGLLHALVGLLKGAAESNREWAESSTSALLNLLTQLHLLSLESDG
jgi:hypothetical protein